MSLFVRSLLRDPYVSRPLSRAVKRFDNDCWYDHYPRTLGRYGLEDYYGAPVHLIDDMNRQMAATLHRINEFAEDLSALDSLVGQLDNRGAKGSNKSRAGEVALKRTESGDIQLSLDVSEFKPEDLKISLVEDALVVEAVTESSGEDSYSKSHFKRWFQLPQDCKVDQIRSKLTEDKKLLIDLPGTKPVEQKKRSIPIEMAKPSQVQGDTQPKEAVENKKA